MFDGIDIVVLPVADTGPLRELYVDAMGFEVVEAGPVGDPGLWARLWGLPLPPADSVLLGKPGSRGGWIRLVGVPGLPSRTRPAAPTVPAPTRSTSTCATPPPPRKPSESGVDVRQRPRRLPPPRHRAPGQERMLGQTRSGLRHAFVQYREGRTRCVLGERPEADVSEVNAVVFATGDLPGARTFVTDVLGGRIYFSDRFEGPAIERLLALSPGTGFEAVIARGPTSRNARLEFLQHVAPLAARPPHAYPRVVAGCAMDDLEALATRLAGGEHGTSTGIVETEEGPQLGLRSRYGACFHFWQR